MGGERGKGEGRLFPKIRFHGSDDNVNLMLDIATHGRRLKYPSTILRPLLEVVRVAFQLLDCNHPLVRIIIPAEHSLIARVRKPKINECIRVALGSRIKVDVQEASFINGGPNFGANEIDLAKETAVAQFFDDRFIPYPHKASRMCRSSVSSCSIARHSR